MGVGVELEAVEAEGAQSFYASPNTPETRPQPIGPVPRLLLHFTWVYLRQRSLGVSSGG